MSNSTLTRMKPISGNQPPMRTNRLTWTITMQNSSSQAIAENESVKSPQWYCAQYTDCPPSNKSIQLKIFNIVHKHCMKINQPLSLHCSHLMPVKDGCQPTPAGPCTSAVPSGVLGKQFEALEFFTGLFCALCHFSRPKPNLNSFLLALHRLT